jgi:aarF domain-containing kinase
MLEASREEMTRKIPSDVHGLNRLFRCAVSFVDQYIYEPVATSLRFLHLVIIFVPVVVTIPAIWFGGRRMDRDNERAGTLWWYRFLVSSMERAGPAFIKVSRLYHLNKTITTDCRPPS